MGPKGDVGQGVSLEITFFDDWQGFILSAFSFCHILLYGECFPSSGKAMSRARNTSIFPVLNNYIKF